MNASESNSEVVVDTTEAGWLRLVREQVSSLRFGVVQIVVHESRVVQVERTEKVRFDKPSSERF